jgi:hypothetical protein
MYAIYIALLFQLCSCAQTSSSVQSAASAWKASSLELLQDGTKSPVSKVAQLLTDMGKTLEEDAKSDEKVNEEMMCWCKTNKATKAKAIEDNTEKAAALHESIKQLTSKSNKLNTQLDALTAKLESDQKELETAIELRKKEAAEFNAAEASTVSSIKSLDSASKALQQGMQHSMLQQSDEGVSVALDQESPIVKQLKKAFHGHGRGSLLWAIHDAEEKRILEKLMKQTQAEDISLIQTGAWSLNAPFGVIHGAIQSMQDSFQASLDSLQDKETSSTAAHAAMKVAKQEEIKAGMAMIDNKREILVDTDEQNVAQKEDLHDTNKALEVDREYLQNVDEQCALHEDEYAARVKTRQEELGAVNGALKVLTSDDTKDLFTSTLGHSKRSQKLGSRDNDDIQEWREDRDVSSKRSQLNAARKQRFGTISRGVAFLQEKSLQRHVRNEHEHQDAESLKTLAKRSEAYWAAHFSMEALKQPNLRPADSNAQAVRPKSAASPQRSLRHQLGLASEAAMVQAMEPSLKDKVHQMQEDLKLQQYEETAKYDWCKNERIDLEKKNSTADRNEDRARTSLKTLEVQLQELKVERKDLMNEQADADVELQLASDQRRKDDSDFQKSTMNQIATQEVLKKALGVLESFYKKKKAASLLSERRWVPTISRSSIAASVASTAMLDESLKGHEYDDDNEDAVDPKQYKIGESPVESEILGESRVANLRVHTNDFITKPAVSPDELEQRAAMQDGLAASWLQQYAVGNPDSSVSLLQRSQRSEPASTAQLLKEAQEQNAEALKTFAAARAIMRQQHEAAMIQQSRGEPAGPPPPAGFKKYEGNRASGGVLLMIQNLIDDSEAMVKEATADETTSLEEYEKFVKETNDVTHERQKAIVDRNARIGKTEGFIAEARMALKEAIDEKARLRQRDIDLHAECDYLVNNYITRKEARTQEIQNLIMAGPMINNMAGEFDDNAVIQQKGGGVAGVVGAPNEDQKNMMQDAFLKNAAAEGKAAALPDEALAAAEALDAARENRVKFKEHPEGVEIAGAGDKRAVLKMDQ